MGNFLKWGRAPVFPGPRGLLVVAGLERGRRAGVARCCIIIIQRDTVPSSNLAEHQQAVGSMPGGEAKEEEVDRDERVTCEAMLLRAIAERSDSTHSYFSQV